MFEVQTLTIMCRNIRGGWPAEHYERLFDIQVTMLSDLIQVSGRTRVDLCMQVLTDWLACWVAFSPFT